MTNSTPHASQGELSQGARCVHPSVDEREDHSLLSGPGVLQLAKVFRVLLGAGIVKAECASGDGLGAKKESCLA